MTATMTCVYASNLLSDAPFVDGQVYQAHRDENKKVFVKCALGIEIEVKLVAGVGGTSVWGCDNNGTYHFVRN